MPEDLILKKIEGLLLDSFLRDYSRPEMLRAIRTLVIWKEKSGIDFAQKWIKLAEEGDPEALDVDNARRLVSHYFQRAIMLYNKNYVSKLFMEAICSLSSTSVIFEIVLPLEKALNPSFESSIFEDLIDICPSLPKSTSKLIPVPKQNRME